MSRLRPHLPALLALALGLMVFGRGMWEGTTRFLGREYVDAWGTQWFYWFVGRQLGAGEGLGHSTLFFHPWGKDIYLHTGGNVLDGLLAWPVRWLLGPVAGYNVFVLALVATNAWAMRRLLRVLGANPEAASLAAVFFAFNPWALHELRDGRPTQALLAFVLLFLADYLRLDTDTRRLLPVRAGAWLALAGLTYWYNALFVGIAAGVLACVRTVRGGPAVFVRHAAAGLTALILVSPFSVPMLRAEDVPGLLDVAKWTLAEWSPITKEGVKIGVYTFDPVTLGSGFYALKDDGGLAFLREATTVFTSQVALLLVGALLAPARIRTAALVFIAVGLAVALGPEAAGVPNPLYHALVQSSSVFQRLWWPSRALVLAQIGLGLLAGFAFLRLRGAAPWVAVLLGAWWAAELHKAKLGPMPTWEAGIPAAYRCLGEAEDGAVIELPYAHTQAHLYYQTVHGRPLFGGMVEDNPVFAPPEQVDYQSENSFVSVLLDHAAAGEQPPVFTDADRAAVQALGYRWVVLDKRAYVDVGDQAARVGRGLEGRARWVRRTLTELLGAPVYEDEQTAIYAPWGDGTPCPEDAE